MDEQQLNTSGDLDQPIDAETDNLNNNQASDSNEERVNQPTEEEVEIVSETMTEAVEPNQIEEQGELSKPKAPTVVTEVSATTISESSAPSQESINQSEQPKKKHTGLILGIIIGIIMLCCGGGFAAFAIIKNQPSNIAMESFSNLLNAKQIAVTGTFTFNPSEKMAEQIGLDASEWMKSITINIDAQSSDSNYSSNTKLSLDYPPTNQPINLEFGEVMMSNGVFYVKASGLQKIYDEILQELLSDSIELSLKSQYEYIVYDNCGFQDDDIDEYVNCLNRENEITDPMILAQIQSQVDIIQSHIENIISDVDDEWFEISIDDILDSDLIADFIDYRTKQSILKARDCFVETNKNLPDYNKELSDLYTNNQFLVLQPSQDSFYRITVDADKMAGYVNGIPKTKLATDYASCVEIDLSKIESDEIKASDIAKGLDYLPDIYAQFDGFFNHHLTALKIDKDYDYYSISSDLHFDYPNNLTISAPTESTPIMEVVEDIIQEVNMIYNELNY